MENCKVRLPCFSRMFYMNIIHSFLHVHIHIYVYMTAHIIPKIQGALVSSVTRTFSHANIDFCQAKTRAPSKYRLEYILLACSYFIDEHTSCCVPQDQTRSKKSESISSLTIIISSFP